MSNYRVRQVLALGPMPDRHLRLLVALATFLGDDTRAVRVGFDAVTKTAGNSHMTVKRARRELADGKQIEYEPGKHRGDLTLWTVWCLPEKGANSVSPLLASGKGANRGAERGLTEPEKGGYPQLADQQEPDRGLVLQAKAPGSLSRALADLRTAVPSLTEREIEAISDHLKSNAEIPHPGAYLRAVITNGDAGEWAEEALRGGRPPGRHAAREPASGRAGPRTEACKRGHHNDCIHPWCRCSCHPDEPQRERLDGGQALTERQAVP